MNILRKVGIIAVSAAMLISSVSCFEHEKLKDDSEIESELESKYGRDFEFVSHKESADKIDELFFRDDKGVEFKVTCVREHNIAADSKVKYSDDYIPNYIKKYSGEYFSGLESAGVRAEINDRNIVTFYVDSYSELDSLYEEVKKLDPPLIYPSGNYISSYMLGIKSSMCDSSIGAIGNDDKEKEARQTYVNYVRYGAIKEELPEEILRQYPAKNLKISINGKDFEDAKAYIQEATGEACIEFKGVYANSKEFIEYYEGLEEFIKAVTGKDVKKIYDSNVIYEVSDSGKEIKKPAENYFEWDGGKLDLYDDEAVDITSSVLRLYEEDIERIFGAKMSADPVFTGILTIEKE